MPNLGQATSNSIEREYEKAEREEEAARLAVQGLVVRCGRAGCEGFIGFSLSDQRRHIKEVHGVIRTAKEGKFKRTCRQCSGVYRTRGPNSRYCSARCRADYMKAERDAKAR